MALSAKISFTVRSILDLPEQDAHVAPQLSPGRSCSSSPGSPWVDSDRSHCLCESPYCCTPAIWFQNHRYKMKRGRMEGSRDLEPAPVLRRVVVPILVQDGKPFNSCDKAGGGIAAATSALAFGLPGYQSFQQPASPFALFPTYQHLTGSSGSRHHWVW
ncbi:hypothetical protein Z043_101130 [Scleropages formosus]|uniref:Uncharacterized protein n=1 Tax=Scleropages formosus TaxID=113540 RepID=A0A0P7VYZ4_SCLFO|nr:hypothetical protein Z043_101130 [Scleropages formosus]